MKTLNQSSKTTRKIINTGFGTFKRVKMLIQNHNKKILLDGKIPILNTDSVGLS